MNLFDRREALKRWKDKILPLKTLQEKLSYLEKNIEVQKDLFSHLSRLQFYQGCTDEQKYVLQSIFIIGEGKTIFKDEPFNLSKIQPLLKTLIEIENFCKEIGGIIGYQCLLLSSLTFSSDQSTHTTSYLPPNCIDITKQTTDVKEKIHLAIQKLPEMGELYALGGAADRLHLQHPVTKKALPAAMMQFNQKSLLEILVEDVKAKEDLYKKIFSKKITIPIGIMTSYEKNNHSAIVLLCEKHNWFGKGKESFFFFTQPSVPVVDEKGHWIVIKPYSLFLKPGGHGAIWKLARQSGCFDWMKRQGKSKVIVRQINNPIAGLDYGLLAFYGYGMSKNYQFGFASCARRVHSAEGVNVLVEKKIGSQYEYALSNIEYCEFQKHGIEDKPVSKNNAYSRFSSNTNLLFADLNAIQEKIDLYPFPGMLVNFKPIFLPSSKKKIFAGRLESTMQNIADAFTEKSEKRSLCYSPKKTFVTYNHRNKTISTTKKVYIPKKNIFETPEKCFYDLLENHFDLLTNHCQFKVPSLTDFETYLQLGPPFLFSYLPSLGPLYSIISQKIQKGILDKDSELSIYLSEVLIQNLEVKGSLLMQGEGMSSFSVLKNVKVENKGIDYQKTIFWKGEIVRKEALEIILSKNSGFYAEDVVFSKGQTIFVEEGKVVEMIGDKSRTVPFEKRRLWKYQFGKENESPIRLTAQKSFRNLSSSKESNP